MTLVSIVTPSLNQARFLRRTMDSVLSQDYHQLEYIVVDGGSSDGSVEIIRDYAPRLAWWVSQPDAGQADAINKGMAHARGEIVAWLNSDDFYLPGAVAAAAQLLDAHPDAVLAYGNTQVVDSEGRITNVLKYGSISLEDLLCFQIIGQPAVFLRRNALESVGGLDTRFHLLLDHQLWIKLAAQGRLACSEEIWAASRHHSGAKNVAAASLFGSEAFKILEWAQHEPELWPVLRTVQRRAWASAHRVDARYLLDAGRPGASLRAWSRALLIHPKTALTRMNILASAILEIVGLGAVRRAIVRRRASSTVP